MAFKIPEKREQLIITAKLAEQCERYDEMLVCMKRVVKSTPDLSSEERNLLSVAYKNVIGSRRACWRAISSLESKEDVKRGAGSQLPLIRAYKKQIEAELGEICVDILDLLDKYLIPASPNEDAKVYFYKMKGDYHRYYAEIDNGDEQRDKALEAYTRATEYATSLKATSPIRLGLALNFSVFYYEILKSPDKGCQLARQAFEEALNDPEVLDEEQHKEAALIMQLLRDNLALWTEDIHPENADDGMKMEDME
jgi:14-3-3 protein epsilon